MIESWEAPKGRRFHRYGLAVTIMDPESKDSMWWEYSTKQWVPDLRRNRESDYSSHGPRVRTYKAFLRHLRRHARELAGRRVVWVNRYMGHELIVQMPEAKK